MWQLISKWGLPIRPTKKGGSYCCAHLKERGGEGRRVITGIRSQESHKRAKRNQVEHCSMGRGKIFVHVIKDWKVADVWRYIRERELRYCRLYDQGLDRVGCVICPNNRKPQDSMQRWPKLWAEAKRAARRYCDAKKPDQDFERYWAAWCARDGKLWDDGDDGDDGGHGLFT